ncbi:MULTISPECIES: RICIN domain-containing protein [unclassified Rathayibacter]|uniref:RICIN domain-containing protein n=1 Tax=unclassified Rathayibacter TaxID=2609250 RepID=UPI0010D6A64F|nr:MULTISPECIES: RICIN domain-containing protein [unclassified Rathayibacter]TCL79484.1 ricin-type beta-trefoil lectin protein [Rathayibacter sp. PhB192]TCM25247.1 ricin-type beta-trefoil lectin protein [Rathayibacter sp. PhB179]
MQKHLRKATLIAGALAATIGLTIPGALSASAYSPSVQSVYTAQNPASCNKNPCVLYPKSAQLPSGRILATFEDSESAVVGQTLPVHKTDDDGRTWQKLADVKAPAFASTDPKYAKYTSNWTNSYLYTLPQDVGALKSGTVLLASVVSGDDAWYREHKAADPNWMPSGDGDRQDLAIALYSSVDEGATWKIENIITEGGWQGGSAGAIGRTSNANSTAQVDPVWEPYLMAYNGQLLAYYSDENDYLGYNATTGAPILDPANQTASDSHGQILAHRSWDGASASWSAPVVDVAGDVVDRSNGTTQIGGGRPGMSTLAQTADGKWLLTFEYFGGGDNVHYKIADDPTKFYSVGGAAGSNITSLATSGPPLATGGSPVLARFPDGRIVYNASGSGNVWVNESGRSDGTWKALQTPIAGGYSRNLQYVAGTGQLMILQAQWAGGSVGPINHVDVDLGRSLGQYYTIVNRATGQVLSTDGDKTQDPPFTGDRPDLLTWDKATANDTQRWRVEKKGSSFSFLNRGGGRSVAIWQGNASAGQQLTQWVDDNGSDKLWNLVPTSDGYYRIQSTKNTSVVWSGAAYGATKLGTVIDAAADPKADDAQEWMLVPEELVATDLTDARRSTRLVGSDSAPVASRVTLDASSSTRFASHAGVAGRVSAFAADGTRTDLGTVSFDAQQKGSVALPAALAAGNDYKIAVAFDTSAPVWDSVRIAPAAPSYPTNAAASTRCVASKVTLMVTTTNTGTTPITVKIDSAFGSKSFAQVAPGASASAAFSTRSGSIPAGEATSTVGPVGSTPTSAASVPYAGRSC